MRLIIDGKRGVSEEGNERQNIAMILLHTNKGQFMFNMSDVEIYTEEGEGVVFTKIPEKEEVV